MGRGASQTAQAPAPVSRKQARRRRHREQVAAELKQIFPDHVVSAELTGKAYEIADPFLEEANGYRESGEYRSLGNGGWTTITPAVHSSSRLYHYCPKMKGNRGTWLVTTVVLDHKTGHLFAVNEAQARVPDGLIGARMSTYKVEDCGTDLDQACKTAQHLYDAAWEQYSTSERGKRVRRVETDMSPMGRRDSPNYDPDIFETDKERIRQNLEHGLAEKVRFEEWIAKDQAEKAIQAARIQAEADRLGYDLNVAA